MVPRRVQHVVVGQLVDRVVVRGEMRVDLVTKARLDQNVTRPVALQIPASVSTALSVLAGTSISSTMVSWISAPRSQWARSATTLFWAPRTSDIRLAVSIDAVGRS
jgi:hypothetical protein